MKLKIYQYRKRAKEILQNPTPEGVEEFKQLEQNYIKDYPQWREVQIGLRQEL